MNARLTEREGVLLLAREFVRAGLSLTEDCPIEVEGGTVHLDAYDPARRVGFEFVTDEAGDRREIGPEVVAALERKMEAGEAWILLVDEWDVEGPDDLALAARRFLGELRSRGVLA